MRSEGQIENSRKNKVIEYYNKVARRYENRFPTEFIGRREMRVFSQMLPSEPIKALDFGCGTGRSTGVLLRANYTLTGYDPSPEMLAMAKSAYPQFERNVEWFNSKNDLAGKQWPLITCIGVMDYFPDAAMLIRELCNYLMPGGTLIFSCPNSLSPLGRIFQVLSRFTCQVYPKSEYTLCAILRAMGFSINEVRYAFPETRGIGHTLFISATLLHE